VPDLPSLLHDEIDAMEETQDAVESLVKEAAADAKEAAKAEGEGAIKSLDELRELFAEMALAVGDDIGDLWDDSYRNGVAFGKKRRGATA